MEFISNLYSFHLVLFIFFTCLKKTNQKNGQPVTWSACGKLPCAAQLCREFENSQSLCPLRGAQTGQTPFAADFVGKYTTADD